MKQQLIKTLAGAGSAALLSLATVNAQAAGFAIAEQSVSGLGSAFAGAAATASDASTVWFNPAGMTKLSGSSATVGLHYIKPTLEFSDSGGSTPGVASGDAGEPAAVPNAYYTNDLGGGVHFGLGINAPFGLTTSYEDGWQGRYYALESGMQTLNINPAIAFKASSKLSVGAGINVQYMQAKLTSAFSNPGACAQLAAILPAPCTVTSDGEVDIEGNSLSWGVNFGVLYDFSQSTHFGFAYRSNVRHNLGGDAKFTNISPEIQAISPAAGGPYFVDSDVSATISTPDTLSFSLVYEASPGLKLLGDVTLTKWDNVKEIAIEYDSGGQGTTAEVMDWKNTGRISFGAEYGLSESTVLRFGMAYDESPTPNEEKRSIRLPDANRTWITLGAGFRPAKDMTIDVGYAHVMVADAEVAKTERGPLNGTFDFGVDVLSVQGSMRF